MGRVAAVRMVAVTEAVMAAVHVAAVLAEGGGAEKAVVARAAAKVVGMAEEARVEARVVVATVVAKAVAVMVVAAVVPWEDRAAMVAMAAMLATVAIEEAPAARRLQIRD